jgi:uracil-DNA glycosylase
MEPDSHQPDPQQDFLTLLDGVAAYVRHLKEDGVDAIETVSAPPVDTAQPDAAPPAAESPEPDRLAPDDTKARLAEIAQRIEACTKCPLAQSRVRAVPGQGHPAPEIMFVGEGPGFEEDRQGLAFVGRAGQLLTKIIEAMGFTRDQVFIGNIVKCRPPENRTPMPDEMNACLPYLKEQIALLRPKVIVALGATAVRGLLDVETGITKLRGRWLRYEDTDLMPTYHPAYLLRNPAGKKDVWEDMKAVLARLGREPPRRGK